MNLAANKIENRPLCYTRACDITWQACDCLHCARLVIAKLPPPLRHPRPPGAILARRLLFPLGFLEYLRHDKCLHMFKRAREFARSKLVSLREIYYPSTWAPTANEI